MPQRTEAKIESRKRRRELLTVLSLACLFLILTAIEIKLFDISRSLPFVTSIFFFGLVNFNIILFLLLFFLIFRNVVKIFAEHPGSWAGKSLKAKLVAAFVAFSFVPTALMFLVSVFYINNSFDKWFSEKIAGVLKSSLEVTNAYYLSAKRKNYDYAAQVAQEMSRTPPAKRAQALEILRKRYSVDALEYYPSLFGPRIVEISKEESIPSIPPLSLELLERGIKDRAEASTIHRFEEGNLVRVIVPSGKGKETGAVVVSTFIPVSLISNMDDVASAYENFRDLNPLEYPIKSIYLIILVLMTLTILLGATWFGFYLAKQLSVPLEELGIAAQRVANRDYEPVTLRTGSIEINQLVQHFNQMTKELEASEREVRDANSHLSFTLSRLNEHSRYMEVVLSTVTTGVVSMDVNEVITMVNLHASKLLEIKDRRLVGKHLKTILKPDYYEIFQSMLGQMRQHKARSIQKELRLDLRGRSIPLQMTLSLLTDENQKEIGQVVVFDDLSPVLGAQRAAAWTEVARRIAHEIKNPLTPIKLSAERLEKKFGKDIKDPVFSDCVRTIVSQVDSLKNLVNEFNQFARLPKSRLVPGDLNGVIDEVVVLFKNAHRKLLIEFSPDSTLPVFSFDPDQMRRVATNLIDNAIASVSKEEAGFVKVKTQFDPMLKIVRMVVADNGPGIPASLRDRIFEPYMTTKEHGTGLGLAIVKRMIEDHHGFIRAFSQPGTNTEFVVELPVEESSTVQESLV
jgi:two-component system, NtrC family, nitrogen regulation sensor histidine kinase NtrY